MNYENDDARAPLPASWRITTSNTSAAASYDEDAIQNGHVLFWITWTHLQCPARSINSLSRPTRLSHLAEESRETDAREV